MGAYQKIFFGKYLLVTNTLSCGVMMGFGDVLQQRSDQWKRQALGKFGESSGVETRSRGGVVNVVSAASPFENKTGNVVGTNSNENKKNVDEANSEHDYVRTKNMFAVGLLQGPFHHYFYAILDRFLPGKNTSSVVKKTLVDQLVASPACLGIFFFGLGALEQRKVEEISGEVKLKFFDTYKVDCFFWPPTQFFNFLFVPVQYRVVYINLMTMFYDIFLSHMKYDA